MNELTTANILYGRFRMPSTQLTVRFDFTCMCFIHQSILMANQESDAEPVYTDRIIRHRIQTIGIEIARDKIEISNTGNDQLIQEVVRIADMELTRHLPINAEGRTRLIQPAVNYLLSALTSRPLSSKDDYDKIWIYCHVRLNFNHSVEEGCEDLDLAFLRPAEDMDLALLQSSQEPEAHMVPAAEGSIESSLNEAGAADDSEETCTMCLEVIRGKACSHLFHGNCITKWLRTSHYCPLCRFELPTEN
ncbi:uncharacterized protein LOC127250193 [Andrographis paniculata]|uniref:uncharacterized protein LOC127250193 n=1 Tax=Andrographis paniculata TaxID=175694 RepID=UPI0021E7CDF9|nr:uncharacterized protein LOC127250193 [Andrographis paniculata]